MDDAQPVSSHVQRITVAFEYPVTFTTDVFAPDNADLISALCLRAESTAPRAGGRHSNVARAARLKTSVPFAERYGDRMALAGDPLCLPGGEAAKSDPSGPAALHERVYALGLDRHSFVLIVGGGALLDVAGWATRRRLYRGLRVVRVPTGALAGGLGRRREERHEPVRREELLGTFAPPWAVLCDQRFLETLDRRNTIATASPRR